MTDETLFGWVKDPAATAAVVGGLPVPLFAATEAAANGWDGAAAVRLWDAAKKVTGGHLATKKQSIGCCVSMGYSSGVNFLQCVEIALGQPESFKYTSHAFIYGAARELGGMLGGGDGLVGAYAAKTVNTVGIVTNEEAGDSDTDDRLAAQWGRRGPPAELKSLARDNPVRTVSLVRSFKEAADAIANGYPVPVCSMQGFAMRRDADGFAAPQGQWAHCMLFCGVAVVNGRRGLCCLNSWGDDWISGPTQLDQPPGSFWVDERVADRMLDDGDSFALSAFDGFPARKLDWYA